MSDYLQELVLSLTTARKLALRALNESTRLRVCDWVMVHFPQEELVHFASFPDHGMALIGFNAAIALVEVYFP